MNTVIGLDPGYKQSAYVVYNGVSIVSHGIRPNDALLRDLAADPRRDAVLVIEEMQMFSGHGVGREVFDSVFWSGRFAQAWAPRPFDRLLRSKVRAQLGAQRGGDAAVRAALIARFGGYTDTAIGTKKKPGPLYGISSHCWSALAIAVVWCDLRPGRSQEEPAPMAAAG